MDSPRSMQLDEFAYHLSDHLIEPNRLPGRYRSTRGCLIRLGAPHEPANSFRRILEKGVPYQVTLYAFKINHNNVY